MQLHGNARTTPYIRREMVRRVRERVEPVTETAAALGVSARTVYKWLDRYEREGEAGLLDRSSRPTCCPHATSAGVVRQIDKLRRRRLTAWQISRRLAVPRSTVSAWLKRLGLAKLDALEPKPEIVRYEYEHPGDLLHLDTKKLARIRRPGHRIHGDRSKRAYGVGWENAHVAIDDHSRVAYVEVLPAEDQHTCTAFLQRAVEHFASMGVAVRRVMTDNGPWLRLEALQSPMPSTRDPAYLHPAPHPQNQRQSRTLHPYTQGAVGLRHLLPDLSSTYSSSTALAQPLQSSPSPRRHRHDTADRSALRGEFVNNLPRTHN